MTSNNISSLFHKLSINEFRQIISKEKNITAKQLANKFCTWMSNSGYNYNSMPLDIYRTMRALIQFKSGNEHPYQSIIITLMANVDFDDGKVFINFILSMWKKHKFIQRDEVQSIIRYIHSNVDSEFDFKLLGIVVDLSEHKDLTDIEIVDLLYLNHYLLSTITDVGNFECQISGLTDGYSMVELLSEAKVANDK